MATFANVCSRLSGGGNNCMDKLRAARATSHSRVIPTPTATAGAGAGVGAGAGASTTAAAARPRKRARTSGNSTARSGAGSAHATRAATGVVATASVTAVQHATAEEVAGQLLMEKTAAEALAATGFTPWDAESPHVYKAGHAAFLAVQEAVEAVHARESLPASVEASVPRLLLLKASASRTGADWWPHTRLYGTTWTPRRAKCGWCVRSLQCHTNNLCRQWP